MANSNISIKLDLQKLTGATVMPVGKDNVECLVIPIAIANLFKGTKGIYIDLTAIPLTNPKQDSKDTHLIKQSFSKEKYAAMSEDERKATPIVGNAIAWGENGSNETAGNKKESAPPSWL